jgi:prepilin-type processing-associated H-X9-DG protein
VTDLPRTQPPAPKTSGLAIASLVCGIIGPCTLGLASLIGIILGIVGLVKIGNAGGAVRGKGLAIAGIVLGGLGIFILPVILLMAAILMPAVHSAVGQAQAVVFMNNARMAGRAAMTFAADHDDEFPPPDNWPQALMEQGGLPSVALNDPSSVEAGRALAMNALLGGMRTRDIPHPSRTVLFFECSPGAPPAGGPELLPRQPRYRSGHVITFADGHVENFARRRMHGLIWDPRGPWTGPPPGPDAPQPWYTE